MYVESNIVIELRKKIFCWSILRIRRPLLIRVEWFYFRHLPFKLFEIYTWILSTSEFHQSRIFLHINDGPFASRRPSKSLNFTVTTHQTIFLSGKIYVEHISA